MNEQQKFEKRKQRTKIILITISVLFMIVMLVLPLFSVITNSLSEGFKFYVSSISTEYVRSALFVTILATLVAVTINTFFGIMAAFLLTKFSFKGKQVLATLIDIPFSISPVIEMCIRDRYLIMDFHPISARQLFFLLLTGLAAAGGQFGVTAAYTYAPAREISVYDYTQIMFSAIMGLLVFGQLPDMLSFVGYCVIIAAGVIMFLYNKRRGGN